MFFNKKQIYLSIIFPLSIFCFGNTKIKAMDKSRSVSLNLDKLNSALHKAAAAGYLNIVKHIVTDNGTTKVNDNSEINLDLTKTEDFDRAIKAAALTGDIKLLKQLVKHFNPNQFHENKKSNQELAQEMQYSANNAIKYAVLQGKTAALKYLLQQKVITSLLTPKGLKEALSFACGRNNAEIVPILIKFIINDDWILRTKENITDAALYCACSNGYYPIVCLLLENAIIRYSFSLQNIKYSRESASLNYKKIKVEYKNAKKSKNKNSEFIQTLKTQKTNFKNILKTLPS